LRFFHPGDVRITLIGGLAVRACSEDHQGLFRHPELGQEAKRQALALEGNSPPDRICTGGQGKRTKHPRRIDVHESRELFGWRAAVDGTTRPSTRTAVAPVLCQRRLLHCERLNSRNGIYGKSVRSLRLDACELDHLRPFLGLIADEFAEISR
jgi:hypothetical protein